IKHPNIVRLVEVIETDKYIGVILEYAASGSLAERISAKHYYLKDSDACKLFSQLLSAVWYLHQRKMAHCDLCIDHLFLDHRRNLVITSLGLAIFGAESDLDKLSEIRHSSPYFVAPEALLSNRENDHFAFDVWSCGVILFVLLAGHLPFDDAADPEGRDPAQLHRLILQTRVTFPEHIS
ncbi:kinase-like protein, partial [Punctularia strigosozonata HHB-11173 SS5]|uniref:kinase-like protein n=1 Tax=Punctularia strigosozonata (strain HHB-11173) TaxID=741275 RepID=UPI0004417A8A